MLKQHFFSIFFRIMAEKLVLNVARLPGLVPVTRRAPLTLCPCDKLPHIIVNILNFYMAIWMCISNKNTIPFYMRSPLIEKIHLLCHVKSFSFWVNKYRLIPTLVFIIIKKSDRSVWFSDAFATAVFVLSIMFCQLSRTFDCWCKHYLPLCLYRIILCNHKYYVYVIFNNIKKLKIFWLLILDNSMYFLVQFSCTFISRR